MATRTHQKRGTILKEFDLLMKRIDTFMDRMFDQKHFGLLHYGQWKPPMDVYETDNGYVAIVDLPGVEKDHIEVTVDQGFLVIRGARRQACPQDTIRCHQAEVSQGDFERRIFLGKGVDSNGITALLKDGVLKLVVPKETP